MNTNFCKQALKEYEEHLKIALAERSVYRKACKESREVMAASPTSAVVPWHTTKFHYSFDFAQQFHFPSDPFQPGSIYFLTPRKCGLFGVCCASSGEF